MLIRGCKEGGKQRGLWSSRICHLNKTLPYIRNYKRLCVWLNSRLTSFSCTLSLSSQERSPYSYTIFWPFNWFILQVIEFPLCCPLDESGGGIAMLIRGCKEGGKQRGLWSSRICHLNKTLPYIRNYKRLCVWFNSRLTSFSCTLSFSSQERSPYSYTIFWPSNWFILQVNKFPFCCAMDESGEGKAMLIRGCKDWGLCIGK